MDLEELKNKWQQTQVRVDDLEKENRRLARELAEGRISTTKQILANKYITQAYIGCFLLPIIAFLIWQIELFSPIILISYALCGVILGILNFIMYRQVTKLSIISEPTIQAISRIIKLRKRQTYLRIIGICFACFVILGMVLDIIRDKDFNTIFIIIISCSIAAIIGFIIGAIKYRKLRTIAKQLESELRDIMTTEDIPLTD